MKRAARTSQDGEVDAILSYYGSGLSFEDACAMANVDASTGRAWREEPEFGLALTRARAQRKMDYLEKLERLADIQGDAKIYQWLAAHLDPVAFGDPQLQLSQMNVNVQNNNVVMAHDLAIRAAHFVQEALEEEANG